LEVPDLIFNSRDMLSYQRFRSHSARQVVDGLLDRQVLEGDHTDLVRQLFEEVQIHPIELEWEQMYQDAPRETDVTLRNQFYDEVAQVRGTRVVVHVPFRGDADLFRVAPTTNNFNPPRADVQDNEVLIVWEGRSGEVAQAKAHVDEVVTQIKTYATWSKNDCDGFNGQLSRDLAGWLRTRKQHLEQNRELAMVLDIPVGRKPHPAPDLVPVPRRRPIAVEAPTPTKDVAREPRISDDDYAAIVDQLFSARGLIERLPQTFSPMGEEALRDLLLVILNNQFGPAGGEMFSRKGKTDILIQKERGPIFIAECKNWGGSKAFADAINQLLDYLVWRDTKAALIVFVREKDVTGITERAVTMFRAHPRFVTDGPAIGDVPTFVLHHEGDVRRLITVGLLVTPIAPIG
jgi:hypothetical protein